MRRGAVGPADRFRVLVVARDVPSDLARQVRDGLEDPAREQIAFDPGKPEFDLVQPRGIGRREVEPDPWMRVEKRVDTLRLVGGQVIDNHMNLGDVPVAVEI